MATPNAYPTIDVCGHADREQLLHDVNSRRTPMIFTSNSGFRAMVLPLELSRPSLKSIEEQEFDRAAFLAAGGSWSDVDTDQLLNRSYGNGKLWNCRQIEL